MFTDVGQEMHLGGLILSFNVHAWFEARMRDAVLPGWQTQHQSVAQGLSSPGWLWGQATLCHLKVVAMLPEKGWPVKRIL